MTEEQIYKYSNLIHSLTHYFEGYKNKEENVFDNNIEILNYYNFDISLCVLSRKYLKTIIFCSLSLKLSIIDDMCILSIIFSSFWSSHILSTNFLGLIIKFKPNDTGSKYFDFKARYF